MTKQELADVQEATMKFTGHPLMPVMLSNGYDAITNLVRSIPVSSREEVAAIQSRFLSTFSNEELDSGLAGSPEFIAALIVMLQESLKRFPEECYKRTRGT